MDEVLGDLVEFDLSVFGKRVETESVTKVAMDSLEEVLTREDFLIADTFNEEGELNDEGDHFGCDVGFGAAKVLRLDDIGLKT